MIRSLILLLGLAGCVAGATSIPDTNREVVCRGGICCGPQGCF